MLRSATGSWALAVLSLTAGCAGAPPPVAHRAPGPETPRAARVAPAPQPPEEPPPPVDARLFVDEPPRCPADMALVLGQICVDRWEASIVQRLPDGSERPWSPYESPSDAELPFRALSQPGVVPQGYISGEQARRACEASGKRLCTAFEWEAACRGPRVTAYPYGDERRKGVCNDDGRALHPVAEVTRRLGLAPERMWYEGMGHPLINQLKDTLQRTGERSDCTNAYGVFDMVGNLHEWIDDPEGTFRGGFYMDTSINGEGCAYRTTAHPASYRDYSTGFRCCLDAEAVE